MGSIYKITNLENEKIYIGQTMHSLTRRFKTHLNRAVRGETSYPLAHAIRKYGRDSFRIELIEECSLDALNERESYWIKNYKSNLFGYNATSGGNYIPTVSKPSHDHQIIILNYEKGKSVKKIAQEMGAGESTIANILKLNNIEILRPHEWVAKTENRQFSVYDIQGQIIQSFLVPSEAYEWILKQNVTPPKNVRTFANNISEKMKTQDGLFAYEFFWARGTKKEVLTQIPTVYLASHSSIQLTSSKRNINKIFNSVDEAALYLIKEDIAKATEHNVRKSILQSIKHNRDYLKITFNFIQQ